MRIDLLITELDVGGAERCCASLASYLKARHHQVRLIAMGPPPDPSRDELYQQLRRADVDMHFLNGQSTASFFTVRRKLSRLIRESPPQIVQSFLWHANVLAASTYPHREIPISGGVRVVEPRRWRAFVARWAASRMKRVVCVSDDVRRWCQNVERVSAEKLCVIPNGVDCEQAVPPISNRARVPEKARLLLFVGRFETQKGIDVLMERGTLLLQQLPEHHLVMIGDGPMLAPWKQFAERSPVRDRIHTLGRRSDVRSWMEASELLVLPTRYEGMPNVVLEAMASRLPCVVTQVEGVAQVLGESRDLQSVPAGDWDAWVQRVVNLAQDTGQRTRIGQSNRTRCEEQFRIELQLARYEELFQSLIQSSVTQQSIPR